MHTLCSVIWYFTDTLLAHARPTMLDIPLSSLPGSRAWEEREPGAHCSRKCQVPLVTCILFRYTKIMVNFFYLKKGSTASWDSYRRWIFIWHNLFWTSSLHRVPAGKLCMREWVELFDEPRPSGIQWAFQSCWPCTLKWRCILCIYTPSNTYFFYGFYFAIGVKAEFMQSTVQCFFLAIIV